MAFSKDKPYNDLPPLPPRVEVESKRVLKLTIAARAALADLKGVGRLIPNQAVLLRSIVLQEARSSSEIENIVTTNDELYEAMSRHEHEGNPQTKEVLRYSEAVWHGCNRLEAGAKLTPDLFAEIATIINDQPTAVRSRPGTRIGNPSAGTVVYTPPEGAEVIQNLLNNLSDYLYFPDDVDPLIKLAVSHYQFEAIHPYLDGNGRTGRVMNILYLVATGLLDLPVLYLSKAIIRDKSAYYDKLRRVTEEQAWEDWILYVLQAIETTAKDTRDRIVAIREAMDETAEVIRQKLPKVYSRELVELIFSQPYTRVAFLVDEGIAQRQTASIYLRELEGIGILESRKAWRDVLYLNPLLMRLLTQ